jgi:hypothetical protein
MLNPTIDFSKIKEKIYKKLLSWLGGPIERGPDGKDHRFLIFLFFSGHACKLFLDYGWYIFFILDILYVIRIFLSFIIHLRKILGITNVH